MAVGSVGINHYGLHCVALRTFGGIVDLYYNKNQTGTLEMQKAFIKLVNENGPYKPNTIDHMKPNGSVKSSMDGNHVMCPDGMIRYGLSSDDADALCFRFNLAVLVGQKLIDGERWKELKLRLDAKIKSCGVHDEHEDDQYQCGICDAYCDINQEIEKIEKG
jgi:hypothetical protein